MAFEPINYAIDVQTPFQSALAGYQAGAVIRDDQLKQQQLAMQQQQQQQQQKALQALMTSPNPTAQDFANATLLLPGMKDQFRQSWDMRNADQQQNDLSHAGQVYAALSSGQPNVAAQLLSNRAAALRNAGNDQDAQHADVMASVVQQNPSLARTMVGMKLASIPGGDKVINGAAALGAEQRSAEQAPAALAKANAEAGIKVVEAGNAPTKIALENQAAINKARIDDLNVQIAQANSETQRGQLILERDKLMAEQGQKAQARGEDAQSQLDTLQRGLQTVQSIKTHPGLESSWGLGGVGTATGKIAGLIPGTNRVDLENLVSTLKSQEFLTGIKQMTGMGALSNSEGDKIASAIASLSLDQSLPAFKNALGVIQSNLEKSQRKLIGSGKLPTTGGGFVLTHPQFGTVNEGDVNRLLAQYPGSTREQVIQYLTQTGGK